MKITADNLLGNAKRINTQRGASQTAQGKDSPERSDRADIAYKVDARLESLSGELRTAQTQLSEKQYMKENLGQVMTQAEKGDDIARMLENAKYDGKKVLLDFLGGNGDTLTMEILTAKNRELDLKIAQDTKNLSRLQVESENILASSLADNSKADAALTQVNRFIGEGRAGDNLTRLNPEVVMRLIR